LTPGSNPAQPKAILELIRFNGDGTLGVPGATLSLNGASRVGPASSHLRSPAKALYARLLKAEVDRLRWAVKVIEVRAPDEIEGAVAEAASRRADALLVATTFQRSCWPEAENRG
jgi:hypothetical protein